MNQEIFKTICNILSKKFGIDYLRDLHTGEPIDMTSEIEETARIIAEAVPERKDNNIIIPGCRAKGYRDGFNAFYDILLKNLKKGK
jgi:hypothetical protein